MGCGQLSCCGKFSGHRVRRTTSAALEVAQQPCSFTSAAAGVAELADALDSKSSDRKIVWVRSPPPARLADLLWATEYLVYIDVAHEGTMGYGPNIVKTARIRTPHHSRVTSRSRDWVTGLRYRTVIRGFRFPDACTDDRAASRPRGGPHWSANHCPSGCANSSTLPGRCPASHQACNKERQCG